MKSYTEVCLRLPFTRLLSRRKYADPGTWYPSTIENHENPLIQRKRPRFTMLISPKFVRPLQLLLLVLPQSFTSSIRHVESVFYIPWKKKKEKNHKHAVRCKHFFCFFFVLYSRGYPIVIDIFLRRCTHTIANALTWLIDFRCFPVVPVANYATSVVGMSLGKKK